MTEEINVDAMASAQDGAMLVMLSFSFGKQSGTDKKLTEETLEEQNAKRGGLTVNKRIICKEAFKPLQDIKVAFRKSVDMVTIPWDIDGMRFCKPKSIKRVIDARDLYGPQFDEKKEKHLIGRYNEWLDTTRAQVGNAFSDSTFPSIEELKQGVFWKLYISALSKAETLRKVKEIDGTLLEHLAKLEDERIKASIKSGMSVAWGRMVEPLQNMVKVLSGEKPRIFESLVNHVNDAVNSIESINLTDDPDLYEFAQKTKSLMSKIDLEELRDDKLLREAVVKKSQSIIETFGSIGKRKLAE